MLCYAIAFIVQSGLKDGFGRNQEIFIGAPRLDTFEIAYLDGGKAKLTNTVITSLVYRGILKIGNVSGSIVRTGDLPSDATELEKAVYEMAVSQHKPSRTSSSAGFFRRSTPLWTMHNDISYSTEALEQKLRYLNLLWSKDQERIGRVAPILLAMIAPIFLAAPKILIDIYRGQTITLLLVAAVLIAFLTAARSFRLPQPTRSRKGDWVLKELRRTHASLLTSAQAGGNLPALEMAKAFALWGPGAVTVVPALAQLYQDLAPGATSDGLVAGSSYPGSSCDDGGGG